MEDCLMTTDVLVNTIFPLLDLPTLLQWRQVCHGTLALLGQAYWRSRLCFPVMGNGTGEKELLDYYDFPNYTGERRLRDKKNPAPLCRLLNILKRRPPAEWYTQKKRIMVLHSAKDRARIHKVAAVLGLYTKTVYTQGVHLFSEKAEEDGYNSGGETLELNIRAVPEVGIVVYWNPQEIPAYDFAPPKAERPLLAEEKNVKKKSRDVWEHGPGYFYSMLGKYLGQQANHTDPIYEEAYRRWREIKGQQDPQWLAWFAEAQAHDPEKIAAKNACNGPYYNKHPRQ
jgi:hypothetical protein